MVHQSIGFGEDLRRRRLDAGLTLTCLARLVHYSKGQLSKVERGIKMPSRDLARLCDAALDAGGALAALFRERPNETGNAFVADDHGEEVWLMRLSAHGQSWFHPMSRRQLMAGSAASIPGLSSGRQKVSDGIDDATLGVRGALAHAAAGEVEHACQLADGLLDAVTGLGSATIATDLHTLARTLSRHPRNAAVRDLAPKLGTAFRAAVS